MTLHPAFRAYLDELNPLIAASQAAGVESTPQSARDALASLNKYALPPVEVAEISDRTVHHRDAAGEEISIPVRVYVPRPGVPSNVIVFVHGGGHMSGDLDVYDYAVRRIAAATGMVVVSVDYRRSPEALFPIGLTDTYQTILHIDEALEGVATKGELFAVADSGGGAKVASIAMRTAAGEWNSPIAKQVLIYPSLDYLLEGESVDKFGTGYFLERGRIEWYFDNYFSDGDDRRVASPVYGPFNAQMPETLVIAAEFDPLLSEAEAYVAKMQAAGAKAQLVVAPGMIHAYTFFETMVPEEVERTFEVIAEFLAGNTPTW